MGSTAAPKGFLRVEGVDVVDGDGKKVILKGVCMTGCEAGNNCY